MRIRISHVTDYTYAGEVRSAVQLLRVTPRSCGSQFVRQWRVMVDADARLERGEDAYGNITHLIFVEGPFERLVITAEGEVETTDTGGIVSGGVERVPQGLFLRETAITAPSPEIKAMARDIQGREGGDPLAVLHGINGALHDMMAFTVGATSAQTTAGQAFAAKSGVCQDFAHVFIAAARCAGYPARYISGHYLRTDAVKQDAGHAWAEAFLPGIGWIGFDPTHGVCATEHHVRVAAGSDSHEAAPVRGARSGGLSEALTVSIEVASGRASTQIQTASGQSQQQ